MANINIITKRKQNLTLIAVAVGLTVVAGVGYYLSQPAQKSVKQKTSKEPVPDMTGVVDTTFDKKIGQKAIADIQNTANQADKKISSFEARLKKLEEEKRHSNEKIVSQENELLQLRSQLESVLGEDGGTSAGMPQPNFGSNKGAVPPPTAFYPPGNAPANYQISPQPRNALSSMTISYDTDKETGPALPYVPSGSFASADIIEGADTNASVTGSSDPSPMQFRLTGKIIMPNDREYDARGCMVTAAGYGDISSERALIRTQNLSCHLNGRTVDIPFKGHVSFAGKNGIKGEPVMRNGKIIGWAFAAGAVDGIGNGVANVGSQTVGLGAVASTSGSDVARGALGGGASQVGKTLSDYYIKRAEQYHPVIPIGAGAEVTVVFQEGFQLKYVADKAKKTTPTEQAKDVANTGITVTADALRDINMGDYIPKSAP
ncbi:F-type conjugal transfer pilus assembly protein TraB [Yersinia enterocolitica]